MTRTLLPVKVWGKNHSTFITLSRRLMRVLLLKTHTHQQANRSVRQAYNGISSALIPTAPFTLNARLASSSVSFACLSRRILSKGGKKEKTQGTIDQPPVCPISPYLSPHHPQLILSSSSSSSPTSLLEHTNKHKRANCHRMILLKCRAGSLLSFVC